MFGNLTEHTVKMHLDFQCFWLCAIRALAHWSPWSVNSELTKNECKVSNERNAQNLKILLNLFEISNQVQI